MEQDFQARIEELERKVSELERYVEDRKRQQISFPLDQASKTIINDI